MIGSSIYAVIKIPVVDLRGIESKIVNLLSNDHLFNSKYKSSIFPLLLMFPILPTKSTNTCFYKQKVSVIDNSKK